jgi:alkanesulfonate monooxygenase SsuD/methylene tetrahydromethanopterin reductase-like flavin-dependent oxidoreductase (luciferase family)
VTGPSVRRSSQAVQQVARTASRAPQIAEQAAPYGDGFFHNIIFGPISHTRQMVQYYRRRYEHNGHGAADQAIVGLGGQFFARKNSQDAIREFRPYVDNAPFHGHGPSMEDFTHETPLTVGQPAAGHRPLRGHTRARRGLPAPACSSSTTPGCR